jgi:hypothetical protein
MQLQSNLRFEGDWLKSKFTLLDGRSRQLTFVPSYNVLHLI